MIKKIYNKKPIIIGLIIFCICLIILFVYQFIHNISLNDTESAVPVFQDNINDYNVDNTNDINDEENYKIKIDYQDANDYQDENDYENKINTLDSPSISLENNNSSKVEATDKFSTSEEKNKSFVAEGYIPVSYQNKYNNYKQLSGSGFTAIISGIKNDNNQNDKLLEVSKNEEIVENKPTVDEENENKEDPRTEETDENKPTVEENENKEDTKTEETVENKPTVDEENENKEDAKTEEPVENNPIVDEEETKKEEISILDDIQETISLDNKYEWNSGSFNNDGTFKEDINSIRLNYYFTLESNNLGFTFTDMSYRMEIKEYDNEFNYIKTVDVGSGDYFAKEANAKYITISMYQYKSGQVVNNTKESLDQAFTDGLVINIEKLDSLDTIIEKNAELTCEVNKNSTSNIANYREGWYYSWGGEYVSGASSSVCTRNYYEIEQKQYTININDSRIIISIHEYDSEGKWIKFSSSLSNGDIWTPQNTSSYISITISSVEWGVNISDILNNGLLVYLADDKYETGTDIVDISNFDFSDFNNWRIGAYSSKTGQFAININNLCTNYLLNVEDDDSTYMVHLKDGYLKMNITEMNSEGEVIATYELQSGQKWTKNSDTSYIGISVSYGTNYTYEDYKKMFKEGSEIKLEIFERYLHNTEMKDITADEFMKIMNVGWNLGNSLDSHYGERTGTGVFGQERTWGNVTITKDLIDYVKYLGFNTIRIPVTWYYNTYTDENGHLHIFEEWLERVQDVVDYAISDDMYVIINTHHDQEIIYAGTDDETIKQVLSDSQDLWIDIATYFNDYDEHLIFESYNEVDNIERSWTFSENAARQMNQLNQVFVDTVRSTGGNNTNRLLIVPTLLDGYEDNYFNSFVLPTDTVNNKLIIEIHNYSTQFDQDIEPLFTKIENFSKSIGAPIIIGEFGTTPSFNPAKYRVQQASNYVARAKAHGINCIYWDDGNIGNYGLIDRRDFSNSNIDILNAIINPVAYETDGKIIFNSMEYFTWNTLNQQTGEIVEDKYWGTIVTDFNGKALKISENAKYMTISLAASGDTASCKVHYVHFYNEDNELVQAYNDSTGFNSRTYTIPDGAVYVRVGINNSYSATSESKYVECLENGDLTLNIGFLK